MINIVFVNVKYTVPGSDTSTINEELVLCPLFGVIDKNVSLLCISSCMYYYSNYKHNTETSPSIVNIQVRILNHGSLVLVPCTA